MGVLNVVCNSLKGPWMFGVFGKEIAEALGFALDLPSDHEFLATYLSGVLIDHNLDPANPEHLSPEFQKRLLLDCPFAKGETTWASALGENVENVRQGGASILFEI